MGNTVLGSANTAKYGCIWPPAKYIRNCTSIRGLQPSRTTYNTAKYICIWPRAQSKYGKNVFPIWAREPARAAPRHQVYLLKKGWGASREGGGGGRWGPRGAGEGGGGGLASLEKLRKERGKGERAFGGTSVSPHPCSSPTTSRRMRVSSSRRSTLPLRSSSL